MFFSTEVYFGHYKDGNDEKIYVMEGNISENSFIGTIVSTKSTDSFHLQLVESDANYQQYVKSDMYFVDKEIEKICNYDLEFSLPKIDGIEKKIIQTLGEKNANSINEYFAKKAEGILGDYSNKMKNFATSQTRHVYFEQLFPILKSKKCIVFKHSFQFQENAFLDIRNNIRLLNYFSDEDKFMVFEDVFDETKKVNLIKLVYQKAKTKLEMDDSMMESY